MPASHLKLSRSAGPDFNTLPPLADDTPSAARPVAENAHPDNDLDLDASASPYTLPPHADSVVESAGSDLEAVFEDGPDLDAEDSPYTQAVPADPVSLSNDQTVDRETDRPIDAGQAQPEDDMDLDAEASPYTRLAPDSGAAATIAPDASLGQAGDKPAADPTGDVQLASVLEGRAETGADTSTSIAPVTESAATPKSPSIPAGARFSHKPTNRGAVDQKLHDPFAAASLQAGAPAAPVLESALGPVRAESSGQADRFDLVADDERTSSPFVPAIESRIQARQVDVDQDAGSGLDAGNDLSDEPGLAREMNVDFDRMDREPDFDEPDDVIAPPPIRKLMPLADRSSNEFKVRGRLRDTTKADYDYRVRLLFRNAGERRTVDPDVPHIVSPLEVVQDLVDSLKGPTPRSPSSWRVNRAAMLNFLHSNKHASENFVQAYDLLVATEGPKKPAKPAATFIDLTSSPFQQPAPRRRKGIPLDDLILLLNTLAGMNTARSDIGSCVQFWLQAGIGAGARIVEWPGTAWLDRTQRLLLIPNAKLKRAKPASLALKEARANGQDVRSVHDLDLDDDDLEDYSIKRAKHRVVRISEENAYWVDLHLSAMWSTVSRAMAHGLSLEDAYKNYYDRCRNELLDACKIAFHGTRGYTLRMARSQFAANAKMTASFEEVAEMMGHEITATTRDHYAPRRAGWRRSPVADKQGQSQNQNAEQGQAEGSQAQRPDHLQAPEQRERD